MKSFPARGLGPLIPLALLASIVFATGACKDEISSGSKEDTSVRERKSYVKHRRKVPPRVVVGNIRWDDPHTMREKIMAVHEIRNLLARMISMVDRRDWSELPSLISKKRGLWVDLKTLKTFPQVLREIKKKNGYLQLFFFHTEKLRAYKNDPESLAVRDVLRYTDTLRADYYMEPDAKECELKLYLVDYPSFNYKLNNPVFIKEQGVWKIYRLF